MVDHSALILALFSTPWTGQSHLPVEVFRGMDSPQCHDLRQFVGRHHPEKMDVFRGTFCHVVSSPEVLSSSPHLMDFRAHEASGGGYLLKVMGPLMVIVRAAHFEIHSPSSLDEVRVFSEGFPMALLEPCKGPPLFPPLVGLLFGSDI